MEKLCIIGANEFQDRLVQKAKQLGYETHVFAWEDGAVAKKNADFFYPVSITEKEKILQISKKINPNGVLSIASDMAVPTVNYVAESLGLSGNSQSCVEVTTNKYRMRQKLAESGFEVPRFIRVCKEDYLGKLESIEAIIKFPLIVKPADRSGSRGVNKLNSKENLKGFIEVAMEESLSGEVILESYIDGEEYSCESISQNGEHYCLQLTKKYTTGPPMFIEKGHIEPAQFEENVKTHIFEYTKKVITALGIKNGASHAEFKINKDGKVQLIEIGSRMGGDFIGSDLVYYSTGIDYVKAVIDIAVGKKLDIEVQPQENSLSAVKFIFSESDIELVEKMKKANDSWIVENSVWRQRSIVKDSSSRWGYCILKCQDTEKNRDVLRRFIEGENL